MADLTIRVVSEVTLTRAEEAAEVMRRYHKHNPEKEPDRYHLDAGTLLVVSASCTKLEGALAGRIVTPTESKGPDDDDEYFVYFLDPSQDEPGALNTTYVKRGDVSLYTGGMAMDVVTPRPRVRALQLGEPEAEPPRPTRRKRGPSAATRTADTRD